MFKLTKGTFVAITDSEEIRDKFMALGFILEATKTKKTKTKEE